MKNILPILGLLLLIGFFIVAVTALESLLGGFGFFIIWVVIIRYLFFYKKSLKEILEIFKNFFSYALSYALGFALLISFVTFFIWLLFYAPPTDVCFAITSNDCL